MANIVITVKIMPESPNINLNNLEDKIKEKIHKFYGNVAFKSEKIPIAFGLNSLNIVFVMKESESSDLILDEIKKLEGISSAEVIDVRRAIG